MSKEKTLGVALVKEACPVCGKLEDGPIIMNTRLSESRAKKVEELHGKTIGYMDKPCQECQEHMKMGIKLIVVDESKSEPNNVYRTGRQYVVSPEFVERVFIGDVKDQTLRKRAAFITEEAEEQLGLKDHLSEEE